MIGRTFCHHLSSRPTRFLLAVESRRAKIYGFLLVGRTTSEVHRHHHWRATVAQLCLTKFLAQPVQRKAEHFLLFPPKKSLQIVLLFMWQYWLKKVFRLEFVKKDVRDFRLEICLHVATHVASPPADRSQTSAHLNMTEMCLWGSFFSLDATLIKTQSPI